MNIKKILILTVVVVVLILLILFARQAFVTSNMVKENIIERTIDVEDTLRVSFYDGVFYVNEVRRPKLQLQRGLYYEFSNSSKEPLYFTTDSQGGEGQPGCLARKRKTLFTGLAEGVIFLRITNDLPDEFYYQSTNSIGAGNIIQLISPYDTQSH
jgi:hypothetical protein